MGIYSRLRVSPSCYPWAPRVDDSGNPARKPVEVGSWNPIIKTKFKKNAMWCSISSTNSMLQPQTKIFELARRNTFVVEDTILEDTNLLKAPKIPRIPKQPTLAAIKRAAEKKKSRLPRQSVWHRDWSWSSWVNGGFFFWSIRIIRKSVPTWMSQEVGKWIVNGLVIITYL